MRVPMRSTKWKGSVRSQIGPQPTAGKYANTYSGSKGLVKMEAKPMSQKKKNFRRMAKETLESDIKDWVAEKTMSALSKEAEKLSENLKSPVGVTGINLTLPSNRKVTIPGSAGDFTNSTSMYAFRPPRRKPENVINYAMKTMATGDTTSSAGVQKIFDINILDMEPVTNNPDSGDKYSNLTIRHAFDKYIKTDFEPFTPQAKITQTSIHVRSLSVDLVFTNKTNDMVFLDIYELVPQHNLGPTAYDSAYKSEYATGYMSPYYTFKTGLETTDTMQLQDIMVAENLQANPFNSTDFSRTWKVVKQVRVNMKGSSVHRHKAVYQINKTISYQEMAQFSTQGGKAAGWNPTYMVIQKGAPGVSQGADASSITYAANMQLNYETNPSRQAKVIVFDDRT